MLQTQLLSGSVAGKSAGRLKHGQCGGAQRRWVRDAREATRCGPTPALEKRRARVVTEREEYRRACGVCVINSSGLVFAARRVDDKHNSLQMPQGGIDAGENPMVAALRELEEETGMTHVRLLEAIDPWLTYDFPTEVRHHLTGDWTRYRGQTQKWFLAHFYGDDSEINLAHSGSPEFSEWAWVPLERLSAEVVPFKRQVYSQVAHHFCPRIRQWLQEQQGT